jgi:penicillin amidase
MPRFPPALRDFVGRSSFARASNVYVVGGARTRSGKPLLANDMHTGLQAPALWYLAALHGGDIEAAGLTIPGLPLVIVGRNRAVGWGFSAAQVDDIDYFIEQIDPADPSRYQTPAGPRPFELRSERILVSGGAPVEHIVRVTRHGPVFSDVEPRANERVLALRWTATEPGRSFHAILAMNRARNADQFTSALADFPAPALNVLYADREGNIGFERAGRIPIRRTGDGLRPAPGWTGSHDWVGYLAPEQAPRSLNPPEGFLVNANNRQIGPGYPHFITRRWADPFRAVRLQQLIMDTPSITVEDAARHQRDLVDTFALRYLPHAIRGAERAGLAEVAAELKQWDGDAGPDSRAAALFYVWFHDLRRVLHEDEAAGKSLPYSYAAVIRLLDAGGGLWTDDTRTPAIESLDEITARAWSKVVQQVGDRRWGDLHQTLYPHALGVSAPVQWLLDVNVGPFPSGGSWHTVDATDFGSDELPIESSFGASQRHIIDLADPDDGGWFLLPTGQSGVPFSPHYRDQTALWRQGQLIPIPLARARAESLAVDRAVLRPQAGEP